MTEFIRSLEQNFNGSGKIQKIVPLIRNKIYDNIFRQLYNRLLILSIFENNDALEENI